MPAPVIPWEPCNIPEEIQDEFNRRKKNRSLRYIEANKGDWENCDYLGDYFEISPDTIPNIIDPSKCYRKK